MIYVEVNFTVAPANKDTAIQCLVDETPHMKSLSGNRGAKLLTNPQTDGAITLLHQWDTLADLDAYRNGPLFAEVGGALRPLMTSAPSTAVYDATLLG